MKKHIYRATDVKKMKWDSIVETTQNKELVLAIDVAKEVQFAMLMDKENEVYASIKWKHPQETGLLLEGLEQLSFSELNVAMEPTGVYGDTLRQQLKQAGYTTFQISGKRVSDATEVYDGVPSQHDAKSAYIIGRLYWSGIGKEWIEATEQQRECKAHCHLYDNNEEQIGRTRNRLEAELQQHWPELSQNLALDSVTLEQVLIEYGSPEKLAADAENAKQLIEKISKGKLKSGKVEAIIEGSINSIGIPCIEAERWRIQQLAKELERLRLNQKVVQKKLEALVENDAELAHMGKLIGKVTTAILLSNNLDPRDYHNTKAYLKAAGLNLKEKSSGKFKGRLKITKRGSGQARKYLYMAVLRLVRLSSVIKRWYKNKLRQHGTENKKRWLVALMRKLTMGLFHVGRGHIFDANKLFNMKGIT